MHPLGADSGLIGRIAVIGGGSLGFAELTDRSSEHLTELFSGMTVKSAWQTTQNECLERIGSPQHGQIITFTSFRIFSFI